MCALPLSDPVRATTRFDQEIVRVPPMQLRSENGFLARVAKDTASGTGRDANSPAPPVIRCGRKQLLPTIVRTAILLDVQVHAISVDGFSEVDSGWGCSHAQRD